MFTKVEVITQEHIDIFGGVRQEVFVRVKVQHHHHWEIVSYHHHHHDVKCVVHLKGTGRYVFCHLRKHHHNYTVLDAQIFEGHGLWLHLI